MDIFEEVRQRRVLLQPEPIERLWDVWRGVNDILVSYLLGDATLDPVDLIDLLKHPGKMYERLQDVAHSLATDTPLARSRIIPDGDLDISLAARIRHYCPDLTAIEIADQILLGRKEDREYVYPNGEALSYFLVVDEFAANMPISTTAFCLSGTQESLFVRQRGLQFLSALAEVAGGYSGFASDQYISSQFDDHILGILLSHEEVEAELLHLSSFESLPLIERELMVEEESGVRLQDRGIPMSSYKLFHRLRSEGTYAPGTNISSVLLQNSQPLAL